jgi:thioester reductase-like protein
VSSLAVFAGGGVLEGRVVNEVTQIDQERHPQSGGYEASKWVAEKLFLLASERGIACNIFRLGLIGPDTKFGRYDERQREYRILKSWFLSGYGVQDYRYEMPLTPVDYAARAVTHLASKHANGKGIFHICALPTAIGDLFTVCNEVGGLSLVQRPYFDWIREIKRLHAEGRSLPAVPLVQFAFQMDERSFREHHDRRERSRPIYECQRTQHELELANIPTPTFDDAALKKLIDRMFASDPELKSLQRPVESAVR